MNEKDAPTSKSKPCADCGRKSVAKLARQANPADTFDLLRKWGLTEEFASQLVELGVRATDEDDPLSVLGIALSASDERAKACKEALDEVQLELEETEEALKECQEHYDHLSNALEGAHSKVPEAGDGPGAVPEIDDEEGDTELPWR